MPLDGKPYSVHLSGWSIHRGKKQIKKPRATGGHCHLRTEIRKACKSASGKSNLKNF